MCLQQEKLPLVNLSVRNVLTWYNYSEIQYFLPLVSPHPSVYNFLSLRSDLYEDIILKESKNHVRVLAYYSDLLGV